MVTSRIEVFSSLRLNKLQIPVIVFSCLLTAGCSINPFVNVQATDQPATPGESRTTSQTTSVGGYPGNKAPDFSLVDMKSHRVITLQSMLHSQKTVFVNAFASWCGPCQSETPDIVQAFRQYKNQVYFVGVNMTSQENSVQDVQHYVSKYQITYPVLLDSKDAFLDGYQISAFPTSLLIDSNGDIIARKTGMFSNQAELVKFLKQALKLK